MQIDIEIDIDLDFSKKPVLMTENEFEKLARKGRINRAIGNVLSSFWFRTPAAATVGFGLGNYIDKNLVHDAHTAGAFVTKLVTHASLIALTIIGSDLIGGRFKDRTRRLASRYSREQMRKISWECFQRDMKEKVIRRVQESQEVRQARTQALWGAYKIPALQPDPQLTGRGLAIVDNLNDVLPTPSNQSFSHTSWKDFYRNARLKRKAIKGIALSRTSSPEFG